MTEPLLCRTADGKIHWTTQSAGGGLRDSREYTTCCGQQVASVIHEPITANDWYHNLTDEEMMSALELLNVKRKDNESR